MNDDIKCSYYYRMICAHYNHWMRSIHPTTKQSIACRLCYQEHADTTLAHDVPAFARFEVTHMQCVFCKCVQSAGPSCCNPDCTMHNRKHRYYCDICHLWENSSKKSIFHCTDCGICRVGKSEHYRHCDKCNMCVPKTSEHKCVGGLAKLNPCPICYCDISQSIDPPVFLHCGHAVHLKCLHEWQQYGGVLAWQYTGCPICRQTTQ